MGAGRYENEHGVGILLNKKWRKRIIDTECINERAIPTTITVNHHHIKLLSVYFPHSGYADHRIEKMCRTTEKHTKSSKKSIQIVGGDFNAELGQGDGVERVSGGPHTLKEGNNRGDWLKQWLMIQNFTALNTMYRKTPGKETTCRSLEGTEDYILIKRRHLKYSKGAEANDMIQMGSDHRCVMATFGLNAQKRIAHPMLTTSRE